MKSKGELLVIVISFRSTFYARFGSQTFFSRLTNHMTASILINFMQFCCAFAIQQNVWNFLGFCFAHFRSLVPRKYPFDGLWITKRNDLCWWFALRGLHWLYVHVSANLFLKHSQSRAAIYFSIYNMKAIFLTFRILFMIFRMRFFAQQLLIIQMIGTKIFFHFRLFCNCNFWNCSRLSCAAFFVFVCFNFLFLAQGTLKKRLDNRNSAFLALRRSKKTNW